MNDEAPLIVVREESTLEKFDENGVLLERITLVDGQIVRKEVF